MSLRKYLFSAGITGVTIIFLFTFSASAYVLEKTETGIPLRWNISPGERIGYSVNLSSCSDITDPNLLLNAVINSFNEWESVSGSFIAFQYQGTTNITSIGIETPCPDNPSQTCLYPDQVSLLVWLDPWPYDPSIIGLTTNWYYTDKGEIISSDIEFNDQHYLWKVLGPDSTCNPQVDTDVVDVQNIVTHEVGHFIGLDHSPVETATMFASSPPCETAKRTLDQDDIDGVIFLYPEASYPRISRVEKAVNSASGELELNIYGNNFIQGAQVYLSKDNSTTSALPARRTEFISSSQLVSYFSLSTLEVKNMWGKLIVIVEQTSGNTTQHAYLPEAIYVEKPQDTQPADQNSGGCTCSKTGEINPLLTSKEWIATLLVLFILKIQAKRGRLT